MWTGSFADSDLVKESSLDRSGGDRAETTVPECVKDIGLLS